MTDQVVTNADDSNINTEKEGQTMTDTTENPGINAETHVEPESVVDNQPAAAITQESAAPVADDAATETTAQEPASEPAAAPKTSTPATGNKSGKKGYWSRQKAKAKARKEASKSDPRKELAKDPRWEEIKAADAEKRNIEITVKDFAVKKVITTKADTKETVTKEVIVGYQIETESGLPGFLPQSEMQTGVKQKAVIGKKLQVKVDTLEFKNTGVKFIVSRRKATADERTAFVAALENGQEVKGKVVNLHEFGYFIGLYMVEGVTEAGETILADYLPPTLIAWLPKSQVPYAEGTREAIVLAVKQGVTARVLDTKPAENKATLSMRPPRQEGSRPERSERRDGGKPEGQRRERKPEGNHGDRRNNNRRDRGASDKDRGPDRVVYSTESKEHTQTPAQAPVAQEPKVKRPSTPRPPKTGNKFTVKSNNFADFFAQLKEQGVGMPGSADASAPVESPAETPAETSTEHNDGGEKPAA